MKILLDTHVFLWLISGDPRLSSSLVSEITSPAHDVFLSIASFWEVIVKHSLGKLPLPQPPSVYLPEQRRRHRVETLPLDEASVARLASLPLLHRDPFDRMIVCQALAHGMSVATVDPVIASYPITVIS